MTVCVSLCNRANAGSQSQKIARANAQFPASFLAEKALCDFLSKRTLSRADQCLDAGRC